MNLSVYSIKSSMYKDEMPKSPSYNQRSDNPKNEFTELVRNKVSEVSRSMNSERIIESLIIGKNDSINHRVSQAQEILKQEQILMFACISSAVGKAIAIIEILKQKYQSPIIQFNQAATHESTVPCLPSASEAQKAGQPKAHNIESPGVLDRDRKHQLSVLYCILTSNESIGGISNWTKQ